MDNIINLDDYRQKKHDDPIEKLIDIIDHLNTLWTQYAQCDKLNALIVKELKVVQRDYLNNLDLIKLLEEEFNVPMVVYRPQALNDSQLGWIAGFRDGKRFILTTEMISENYARCFCILFYHQFTTYTT